MMRPTIYHRQDEQLSPEALRDLEAYFAQLRAYYGIPDDQPVFPPRPRRGPADAQRRRRRVTVRNRADHPWRNTL
jgi:cytochrome c553